MTPAKRSGPRSFDAHSRSSAQKPSQQKTIFEHFACSKQTSGDTAPSPPSKRRRLASDEKDTGNLPTHPDRASLLGEMYTFTSRSPQDSTEVVDLTSSSNDSPYASSPRGILRSKICAPSTGPKRLIVKNLKKSAGPDPQQYYDDVWKRLDDSVDAILRNESPRYSQEVLYNEVMILCRQNRSRPLFNAIKSKFSQHVVHNVLATLQSKAELTSDVDFLQAAVDTWSIWIKQLESIRAIFFFLDRSYVLHAGLPSIKDTGTREFQIAILDDAVLQRKLLCGVRDLMLAQRRTPGLSSGISLLQRAVKMFQLLGAYGSILEPSVLSESQQFYLDWVNQTAASTDLAGYAEMCDQIIIREMDCAQQWALDPSTAKQLEGYLEDVLIDGRKDRLLDSSAIGDLLAQDKVPSLRRIYLLLERKNLGSHIKEAFEAYIVREGSDIIFDEKRESDMVLRLLDYKKRLDRTWESAFMKNLELGHTLREAFEIFINKSKRSNMTWGTDNPKPGEMIAKHVDRILRGGLRAIRSSGLNEDEEAPNGAHDLEASSDDEEVEIGKQLDQVLELFRFVHGKAVFEAFYKRDLARRLLLGRSASSDAERSMLTRLKSGEYMIPSCALLTLTNQHIECGAGFTHNLEQMFKDIEMAREEITSYKSMLVERHEQSPFDLTANVLSSSAWPSYPDVRVNVPEMVLRSIANFEQHYRMKHSGRKLEWKHALAHCQLKSAFAKGAKEVVVSSFQAIVLLAFNDVDTLSYEELQAITGLGKSSLVTASSPISR